MTQKNIIHETVANHPGKKLIIFGAGNGGLYVYYHALEYGVQTAYFVDNQKAGSEFCHREVRSPYDLMYENPEEILIIIGVNQSNALKSIISQLEGMGLKKGEHFVIPEFGSLYAPADYLDPLLAYSRMDDLPGFKVNRSTAEKPLKIFCLGGSTSDWSFGGYRCWGDFYCQILAENGIAADFYNGAMAGYHSSLELLKLIRDVIPMKPDVLLILNGVNDGNQYPLAHHPMHHAYTGKVFERFAAPENASGLEINGAIKGVLYGPDDDTSALETYFRNMRMMKTLCDEFKICFFPVLQPTKTFQKAVIPDMPLVKFYSEAVTNLALHTFIADGTQWLGEGENMYFDYIHYNENGNRKIAQKFFELTLPALKELKK